MPGTEASDFRTRALEIAYEIARKSVGEVESFAYVLSQADSIDLSPADLAKRKEAAKDFASFVNDVFQALMQAK